MRELSLEQKLHLLMSLATDDREGLPPRLRHTDEVGSLRPLNIRDLRPRAGFRIKLLRILMTNACSYNCHYCPMRRDRPMPRTLLKPSELVRIFLAALQRGWCEGLFITTGIPGRPVKVMDDLIEVLELLRERHRFAGYIHVKIVPGAEAAQIDRLTTLASRVSINSRRRAVPVSHASLRRRASRPRCKTSSGFRSSCSWNERRETTASLATRYTLGVPVV